MALLEHPIIHVPGMVLLLGTDCEGDARNIPLRSLNRAIAVAAEMTAGDNAWRGWAVWGNDPSDNDRFKCVAASDPEMVGQV